MLYDQTKQPYTRNACWIYACLNYFRYEYWVYLPDDSVIIKICEYLARIDAWFEKWGADANIAGPALMKYIKYKTWFKLKIVKSSIDRINTDRGYVIWFKKASRLYLKLAQDKKLDKNDINEIKANKWGYGHFLFYKREKAVDSLWWYWYDFSFNDLKYARDLDLFYNSVRQFVPADTRTAVMQVECVNLAKKRGKFIELDELMKMDFK